MKKLKHYFVFVLSIGLVMSACQPSKPVNKPSSNGTLSYGNLIMVQSVEVLMFETFPLQARAVIKGLLKDECMEAIEIDTELKDQTFVLTFDAKILSSSVDCKNEPKPFEEIVNLDIEGLNAGTYTVIAQNEQVQLTLNVDNELGFEPSGSAIEKYGKTVESIAVVENISVYVKEGFTVQVSVVVTGYLPNGCITIRDVRSSRDGNLFTIQIMTDTPEAGVSCTMALVPFEEEIHLNVEGFKAGVYTVKAGDLRETFNLETSK